MRRLLLAALAGLVLPLGPALAQTPGGAAPAAGRECRLRVQAGGVMEREGTIINILDPFQVFCDDGAHLRATAGTVDQVQRIVTLTGNVYFEDATRSLTSDRAVYNSASGMLHATGNVVFTDRVEGTTLTGPELEYYRATETRPDALVNAYGRPRLTMQRLPTARDSVQADTGVAAAPVPAGGGAPADTAGMPLTIDADRMTIVGENDLTAVGNVVIRDDDMRAVADEAEQRGSSETLELRGNASIHSAEYSLEAAVIFATIPEGAIREVEARRDARLLGKDLNVEAPQLNLLFEGNLLQRTIARSDPASAPGVRPLATSPTFRLEADSLDASLPGQQLDLVIAIGDARGEMIDTTRAVVPVHFPADTLGADTLGLPTDSAGAPPGQRADRPPAADSLAIGTPVARGDSLPPASTDSTGLAELRRGGVEAMFAGGDSVVTVSAERLVQNDWIAGDTITGHFTTVVESPEDSVPALEEEAAGDPGVEANGEANGEASDPLVVSEPGVEATPAGADTTLVMERLVAVGNAYSLYHVPPQDEDGPDARPGINFLSAARIELTFAEGRVHEAEVSGLRRGLYLEPMTAADSARAEAEAEEEQGEEGQAEPEETGEGEDGLELPPETDGFPPDESFEEPFDEPDPVMVPEPGETEPQSGDADG